MILHDDDTIPDIEQSVYIVEDDEVIRNILRKILEQENIPVKTYASAEQFLLEYSAANAGCLLLDIKMPGMNGLELHRVVTALGNSSPVIFLTGVADVGIAVDALKAGAMDLLEKPFDRETVLDRIQKAMAWDLEARLNQLETEDIKQRIARLTPREREVMDGVVQGLANKSIARNLGISSRTVEVHRKNIIEKMRADSLADLVRMTIAAK
ncbi:Transcriptional regulatory protein FixJ [Halioglobus japonicus]|nr:Transcriptional regulatory protein FixJ [Halioglobus japonicus]